MSRAAIFLDRDGTLNEDVGYLDRIERLRLFPWSLEAIRLFRRAGYAVVVTTNQAGIARGMIGEAIVDEVADEIRRRLSAIGEALDGHYMCPHHPDGSVSAHAIDCDCRKPGPGLVRRAVADLDLDVARSVVVGDKWSDIGMARAAGTKAVLVKTGYGTSQMRDPPDGVTADAVVETLADAVGWVLRTLPRPGVS